MKLFKRPGILKKFFEMVAKSCEIGAGTSSTRLISYIITGIIVLFSLYFLSVGIYVLITATATVLIPTELLIIFGSLLAHQLTLLGINKHNETKQKISKDNSKNQNSNILNS